MLWTVIPAHNEEKRIERTLSAFVEVFSRELPRESYKIVVVANACKDKTAQIVHSYMRKHKEIVLLDYTQGGKGFAVRKGFSYAMEQSSSSSDVIGFVDADLATSPEDYLSLYRTMGPSPGVIANRWDPQSEIVRTRSKYIRSRGFNLFVRLLLHLPYTDTQCGAKVFRRDTIPLLLREVHSMHWAFDVDMLFILSRSGLLLKEHPTVWHDREGSNIRPLTPLQMALGVLRLRLLFSPLKDLVRGYNLLFKGSPLHK